MFTERSVKMIEGSIKHNRYNEIFYFRGCMLLKYAVKICITIIFSLTISNTSPVKAVNNNNPISYESN